MFDMHRPFFFRSRLRPSVTANTRFLEEDVVLSGCHVPDGKVSIKTESIKKLSNFNFHWTKTLYQNILSLIAFFLFFTLFKGYRYNQLSVITPKKNS